MQTRKSVGSRLTQLAARLQSYMPRRDRGRATAHGPVSSLAPTRAEYQQAAIEYPGKLTAGGHYYQYVKPFDASVDKAPSVRLFHSFATMLEILALPPGARVLDLACGPGWLAEFLARSGYDVTGIDISPDMIDIARERVRSNRFGPYEGRPLSIRFSVGDAETEDLGEERYHAAVFHDSLHHFPNPRVVLKRVISALGPGGKLYIMEGIRPPEGSEDEKKLIEEMAHYGTLEKPFDQSDLLNLLHEVGFVRVQAYEAINLILRRDGQETMPALKDVPVPLTNTVLARKPGDSYDSEFPNVLRADVRVVDQSLPESVDAGETVQVTVSLKNVGDTLWLAQRTLGGGFVTLGAKVSDANKHLLSNVLKRSLLPKDVAPGQRIVMKHQFTVPNTPGTYWMKLDLEYETLVKRPFLPNFGVRLKF